MAAGRWLGSRTMATLASRWRRCSKSMAKLSGSSARQCIGRWLSSWAVIPDWCCWKKNLQHVQCRDSGQGNNKAYRWWENKYGDIAAAKDVSTAAKPCHHFLSVWIPYQSRNFFISQRCLIISRYNLKKYCKNETLQPQGPIFQLVYFFLSFCSFLVPVGHLSL